MFIRNPLSSEVIQAEASKFGLIFGETCDEGRCARPGFVGNTFLVKGQLKAAGAKWDGLNKAWTFDDWNAAEAALKTLN